MWFILGGALLLIGSSYRLGRQIRESRSTSLTPRGYELRCLLLFVIGSCLLVARGVNIGQKYSPTNADTETMIMLDVSKSMLVQDTPTHLPRLEYAKQLITTLLAARPATKRGLGIFAGETQGVLPLTQDTDLLLTLLAGLDHRNLTKQGSSLSEALTYGMQRFSSGDHLKTLLIFSDGGDEEVSIPEQLSDQIKKQHIEVMTIGIGSPEGGPVPEGVDVFGNVVTKQWQGQTVISTLESSALKKLVKTVGGKYTDGENFSANQLSVTLSEGGFLGLADTTSIFVLLALIGTLLLLILHLGGWGSSREALIHRLQQLRRSLPYAQKDH